MVLILLLSIFDLVTAFETSHKVSPNEKEARSIYSTRHSMKHLQLSNPAIEGVHDVGKKCL